MWMDWVLYEMSEHPPSLLLSVHLVQEGSGVSGNGHGRALDHGAGWRSGRHAGRLLLPPLGFFLLQPLFSHLTPIHGGVGTWPGGNTDGVLVLCSVMYNVPSTDAAIEVIIIETTQKTRLKKKRKHEHLWRNRCIKNHSFELKCLQHWIFTQKIHHVTWFCI